MEAWRHGVDGRPHSHRSMGRGQLYFNVTVLLTVKSLKSQSVKLSIVENFGLVKQCN